MDVTLLLGDLHTPGGRRGDSTPALERQVMGAPINWLPTSRRRTALFPWPVGKKIRPGERPGREPIIENVNHNR